MHFRPRSINACLSSIGHASPVSEEGFRRAFMDVSPGPGVEEGETAVGVISCTPPPQRSYS